jgi:hypothetical protein
MVTWQQTLLPALVFYVLAGLIAMGVAAMIAGLASLLGKLEAQGKKGGA